MAENIAILSKNYREHLDNASKKDGLVVTFYSNSTWVKASARLSQQEAMSIYFVVDGGTVEYEGTITDILLNPNPNAPETKEMLAHCLDDGAKEELDKGKLKTLYYVKGLKKLTKPFSQTELKKTNGKPVSEKYDRGYCKVGVRP